MDLTMAQGTVEKIFSHMNNSSGKSSVYSNGADRAFSNGSACNNKIDCNIKSKCKMGHERVEAVLKKDDEDIVIVSAVRTPICKAKKGALADVHWMEYLAQVLRASVEKIGLDARLVDDIQVGTVLAVGGGVHPSRMAQFMAQFPETTCISTTNRQCSSGLQSVATVAAAIKSGYIEIGIGAGVESMTENNMQSAIGSLCENCHLNEKARDCLIYMGQTSENVAERFGITRDEQDLFALLSYQKASLAQKNGLFDDEIVPVCIKSSDKTIHVNKDDGIRHTTIDALRKLKPAFKDNGTTTAGNCSQLSDGAAAVVLMKRKRAKELGLTPIAKFISFAVAGVPPDIMGIGPAVAIPKVLDQVGLTVDDIEIFEINEAFASQCCYVIKKLEIHPDKVNPLGGAISIGHPLGATGTRQISTLVHHLKRTGKRLGIVSMCVGTGMGAAAIFSNEDC